jgi:hypothetical protein
LHVSESGQAPAARPISNGITRKRTTSGTDGAPRGVRTKRSNAEQRSAHDVRKTERTCIAEWVTDGGMHVTCYDVPLADVPADFFADPDGAWTYDALVQAAGFAAYRGVAIGALKDVYESHPEGAAVVTLNAESRPYVAIVECPIAYQCVASADALASPAA